MRLDYPGSFGWALNAITSVPKREVEGNLTNTERGNVTTGSQIEMIWPKAKECQQSSEAGKSKQQTLSWSFHKEPALLTP